MDYVFIILHDIKECIDYNLSCSVLIFATIDYEWTDCVMFFFVFPAGVSEK